MIVEDTPDLDTIAATLAAWEVPYLRGVEEVEPLDISAENLIALLASTPNPRVNEALIPFFLRYPQYHSSVRQLVQQLNHDAATTLKRLYTAVVYLQRYCRTALSIYLNDLMILPDYFGQTEFGLDAPSAFFGELGLRQLSQNLHRETGYEWFQLFENALNLSLKMFQMQSCHEPSYA